MAGGLSPEEAEAELKKGFESIEVLQEDPSVPVYHLYLNRPSQRNALSLPFFLSDLPRALSLLSVTPSCRVLVLSARGPHFCSGIDISALSSLSSSPHPAPLRLRLHILSLQSAITALETFPKPVLAAVHGACVGGGVDLATACDVRHCTVSAFFSVKEVDLGLAADLGTLQRLPRIVGHGRAAEMALTGRAVAAAEAREIGLVTRVWETREEMEAEVKAVAKELAEKSPVAIMGTKAVLVKSRDLTVEQGLDYVAAWNAGMLGSGDLEEAVRAKFEKRKPVFTSKI